MWDAAAISVAFPIQLLNDRIPRSRKVSSKHDNTLLLINKVWLDSMTNPVGPPSLSLKVETLCIMLQGLSFLWVGQVKGFNQKKLTAQSKGF